MTGIGIVRGGAQSWIGVGVFSIQPSEFMKLGWIIFLAAFLSTYQTYITSFRKVFFPAVMLIFTAFAIIMLQLDLGTCVVLVLRCLLCIFLVCVQLCSLFVV